MKYGRITDGSLSVGLLVAWYKWELQYYGRKPLITRTGTVYSYRTRTSTWLPPAHTCSIPYEYLADEPAQTVRPARSTGSARLPLHQGAD